MKFFVTGGAGFIGSNFCDTALAAGHEVVCFDDFSTGSESFIADARLRSGFYVVKGDVRVPESVGNAVEEHAPDWIMHFAANADVRRGLEHPRKDLDYNVIGTWNVLEAARRARVRNFFFSSTAVVYGEPDIYPTPESAPFPEQTSLYGASKAAAEALISAYCHGYGMTGVVFRFVSILGPRYSHGHVFDFVKKLQENPHELEVLGDGKQAKSYLHVADLVQGIMDGINASGRSGIPFTVYNIGYDRAVPLTESIGIIAERMRLAPALRFTGGSRGWIGDSPRVELDTSKLRALGWTPKRTIEESVRDTVDYLLAHPDVLRRA